MRGSCKVANKMTLRETTLGELPSNIWHDVGTTNRLDFGGSKFR